MKYLFCTHFLRATLLFALHTLNGAHGLADTCAIIHNNRRYTHNDIAELIKKPLICFQDTQGSLAGKSPTMHLSPAVKKYITSKLSTITEAYRELYSLKLMLGVSGHATVLFCPHKNCDYAIIRDSTGTVVVGCPNPNHTSSPPQQHRSFLTRAWSSISIWARSFWQRISRR